METTLALTNCWDTSLTLEDNISLTPLMLILLRNCRGANNQGFHAHMHELLNCHKSSLVVLIKTKLSGQEADDHIQSFNYANSVRVDAEGSWRLICNEKWRYYCPNSIIQYIRIISLCPDKQEFTVVYYHCCLC